MYYFLQGLIMGFAYVAPIGLQNMFVINSALTYPRKRALLTALIVIFFDVSLAFACFFGIGAIMQHYAHLQMLILFLGSLVVLYIGLSLLKAKPAEINVSNHVLSIKKTISSACVVSWFNPQAIIDGTMMLGAFHASLPADQSLAFIFGVALASCLWFTMLTLFLSIFRNRFTANTLKTINIICGIIIIFYGCKLFFNFCQMF